MSPTYFCPLIRAFNSAIYSFKEFKGSLPSSSIFRKSAQKSQFSLKLDKNKGYFTWRPIHICDHISRIGNVWDKICRENQNMYFMFSNFFVFENRAVYELMRLNTAEPGKPQMTIWHMRIECWIPKATSIHTEYVKIHSNHGYTNSPQSYVMHSLPVLFVSKMHAPVISFSRILSLCYVTFFIILLLSLL